MIAAEKPLKRQLVFIRISCRLIDMCLVMFTTLAGLNAQEKLTGIKCVVDGEKTALLDTSVQYKEGRVYFCCDSSADAFREDIKLNGDAQFTTKANHQLILTGQYVQKRCPISGEAIDKNLIVDIAGTKIGFSCDRCYNKVKNAGNLEAKAKLIFAESVFPKAFEKKTTQIKCTTESATTNRD